MLFMLRLTSHKVKDGVRLVGRAAIEASALREVTKTYLKPLSDPCLSSSLLQLRCVVVQAGCLTPFLNDSASDLVLYCVAQKSVRNPRARSEKKVIHTPSVDHFEIHTLLITVPTITIQLHLLKHAL